MTPYARLDPTSGVVAFEPGVDFIRVQFVHSRTIYTYSTRSAGSRAVATMLQLANAGEGLSTYIAQNKPPYAFKTE